MHEKLSWIFFNRAWNKHFLECKSEHWGLIECVLFFHSDTSDALKACLDSVLCHSRDGAEKTYNRQTASQSKESAVHVARECAQEIISNPTMTETTHNSTVCVKPPVTTKHKAYPIRMIDWSQPTKTELKITPNTGANATKFFTLATES